MLLMTVSSNQKKDKKMKIEFNRELKTLDGESMKMNDKPLTLRSASVEALLIPKQGDSGTDKAKSYALAMKIHQSNGQVDLTIDEAAELKKRIGENMTPLVVGQAWEMLDPKIKS